MQEKVIKALQSGKTLTVAQLEAYGFARPHNAISVARSRGLDVIRSTKKVKNKQVSVYALSTKTGA